MRKTLLNLTKLALGLGVVAWLIFTGRLDLSLMLAPQGKDLFWLVLILVSLVVLILMAALRWWVLSRVAEEGRDFGSCLRLTLIGAFFSTFLPGFTGGDIARLWYAVKERKGKRVEGVTVILFDRFLGLSAMFLLAAVGILFLMDQPFGPPLLALLLMALAGCLAAYMFGERLLGLPGIRRLTGRLLGAETPGRIAAAMQLYRRHWPATLGMVAFSLVAHLLQALTVLFAGRFLGDQSSVASYLVFVPLVLLAGSIPITPAGLGVTEGLGGMLWAAVGSTAGASIIFLFRLARTAMWLVMGLPVYLVAKGDKPSE
jgi:uncharacterized membrane protein YbhN (UPF0104 family)